MDKLNWINSKIHTRENMARTCHAWRAAGNKIVFTNGCFDILHHGHLDLLARAASRAVAARKAACGGGGDRRGAATGDGGRRGEATPGSRPSAATE
ncbi:MAG: hypothetical protein EBZ77_15670 [Chitinophagia bacterium]|nr:hypothetical protein [Chitinophagia bacterium]